jgi:hypothetical protein
MRYIRVRSSIVAFVSLMAVVLSGTPSLAQIPPVPRVPPNLLERLREKLDTQAQMLTSEFSQLQVAAGAFNSKCASVEVGSALADECATEQPSIVAQKEHYISDVNAFQAVINDAVATNQRCSDLRQALDSTRAVLERQKDASAQIADTSLEQPGAIAARSGMIAAKLGKLVSQFNEVSAVCEEATERLADKRNLVALGISAAPGTIQTMTFTWNGLKAVRDAQTCAEEIKTTSSSSALTKKVAAIASCTDSLHSALKWIQVNGPLMEKIAGPLGIVVSAADLANEINDARSDLADLELYIVQNPNQALEAADKLKSLEVKRVAELKHCEKYLNSL